MRFIFIVLLLLTGIAGCKKVEEGFLSDTLRYKDQNIYCRRGLALVQSGRINTDGSTPPIIFKLLNLRDSAGKPAPKEFTQEYDVLQFKAGESFDINTDTTVALLDKKRELKKTTPMVFNEVSGQLTFNKASANLPLGRYLFDIMATNVRGTKTFPSFGQIVVTDPEKEDVFVQEDGVANAFSDASGAATPMKNPKVIFTKLSNDGARIILKITDKDGASFNPKAGEIIKRGDRPVFENYAKFNPVIVTDTALICDFEVAPFPLANYKDAVTDWGHLIYYRIPSKYVTIDGFAAGKFSANPRFAFRLKMEGTYSVEFRLTDAVRNK